MAHSLATVTHLRVAPFLYSVMAASRCSTAWACVIFRTGAAVVAVAAFALGCGAAAELCEALAAECCAAPLVDDVAEGSVPAPSFFPHPLARSAAPTATSAPAPRALPIHFMHPSSG